MQQVRNNLPNLLGTSTPVLTNIARYYFLHPSKQLRPFLVLLFANATNGLGSNWITKKSCVHSGLLDLDMPLSRPDVLNDWNPLLPSHSAPFNQHFPLIPLTNTAPRSSPEPSHRPPLLPTQIRLAQVVEMIHVASLLHDDVIDRSPLRRGHPSAPAAHGNKLSILAGNFVLGRASSALSRLGDSQVTELIANVIANLVEGELIHIQMDGAINESSASSNLETDCATALRRQAWEFYMRRTYLKTASLIANGVRASVALGGCTESDVWQKVAYKYGRHLGLAFQLVDDILDYEAGESTLGKPGGADLQLGLATGPALYAWEEHPQMGPLIARKFEQEGDVEIARDLVRRSKGIQRTRDLASAHAQQAKQAIEILPDTPAKIALQDMTDKVIKRTH